MKSTIRVELGTLNKPVIRFNVNPSDDVRDQLACQFLQGLEYTSNLCYVEIRPSSSDTRIEHTLDISPIGADPTEFFLKLSPHQRASLVDSLITMDRGSSGIPAPPLSVDDNLPMLPSRYQIDDSISTDEIFDGQVVCVKFTIGKVYYDILDKLTTIVHRDVDSSLIAQPPVKMDQA